MVTGHKYYNKTTNNNKQKCKFY